MNYEKWLLIGSALSVLSFSQGAAQARDFKVTLSGDAQFQVPFGGQDKDTRSTDFRNRFRLWVDPEAKALDGASTYGAKLRLKTESNGGSSTYDRASTYVSGAFGTAMGGTNTTYNDDVGAVGSPGAWRPESDVAPAFTGLGEGRSSTTVGGLEAWRSDTLDPTGSNTDIRCRSPFISGFQVGVGFTPASAADGESVGGRTFNRAKSGLTNAYEIGVLGVVCGRGRNPTLSQGRAFRSP